MSNSPAIKPQFIQFIESLALPFRLLLDKDVPLNAKLIPIGIFLLYLFLPIDLIIDYIPVLGAVDDAAVFTGCAYLIVKLTPEKVLEKYTQSENIDDDKKEKIIDITKKDK